MCVCVCVCVRECLSVCVCLVSRSFDVSLFVLHQVGGFLAGLQSAETLR